MNIIWTSYDLGFQEKERQVHNNAQRSVEESLLS